MEERIRRFRELSSRLVGDRAGRGSWYPQEVREEAVGCAQAALAEGGSLRDVSVALGVSHASLCRWVAREKRAALRKVRSWRVSRLALRARAGWCW